MWEVGKNSGRDLLGEGGKADIALKGAVPRTLAYLTIENLDTKKKKEPECEQSSPSVGQEDFFFFRLFTSSRIFPKEHLLSRHTHIL